MNQELIEIYEEKADALLTRIDDLPKHLVATADLVGKDCQLLPQMAWETFVVGLEELCSELFYKERKRLQGIVGDRPEPESMIKPMGKVAKVLFDDLGSAF